MKHARNFVYWHCRSAARWRGWRAPVTVLGVEYNLTSFSAGYGFDSIAIALLAKSTNPIGIIRRRFSEGCAAEWNGRPDAAAN